MADQNEYEVPGSSPAGSSKGGSSAGSPSADGRAELDIWRAFVDSYVDGSLAADDALRLKLAAERSGPLREEIRAVRAFQAALSELPRVAPPAGFDQRVLDSIPYQRYETAPRRSPIVIILGDLAPTFLQRWIVRLGKGLSALALAWFALLGVGATAWQGRISGFAVDLGLRLDAWAAGAEGTPVVDPVASAISGLYDAALGACSQFAGWVGGPMAVILLGSVAGLAGLWFLSRRRPVRGGQITDRS